MVEALKFIQSKSILIQSSNPLGKKKQMLESTKKGLVFILHLYATTKLKHIFIYLGFFF